VGFCNNGKDLVARAIGGDSTGFTGTSTATSATSMTDSGAAFPASSGGPPAQAGLTGHIVQAGTVYGVVISNTSTVLTVDMWHSMTAPDTVGSTPGATTAYNVLPGGAPCYFTGISVATRAFNAADAFLSNDGTTISELWFSGGGLKRKLATWAHTTGTGTFTLTTTWTANGSDTLPQTIAKWGAFQAEVTAAPTTSTTGPMLFNTNLGSTATLAASGDNVQVVDTITES
jgi:hypothetical protein